MPRPIDIANTRWHTAGMPYIVTTKRSTHVCLSTPGRCEDPPVESRHAVATLEDVHAAVLETIAASAPGPLSAVRRGTPRSLARVDLFSLPESGGSVGPLPDGTVIEVVAVRWPELLNELPTEDRARLADTNASSDAEVLAAYNAAATGVSA